MNAETRAKVERMQQTIGQLEWQLRSVVKHQQDKGAISPCHPADWWAKNFDSGIKSGGKASRKG